MVSFLQHLLQVPIPEIPAVSCWKQVPIEENFEPLVQMSEGVYPGLICRPQYHAAGIPGALDCCYFRQGVFHRLMKAVDRLRAESYTLVIWDAWRPIHVQQAIYDSFRARSRSEYPLMPDEELDRVTQTFVSLPSDDPTRPSPHYTGGAVDLTLGDSQGCELRMGTGFDDFSELAMTRYFETSKNTLTSSLEDRECMENRRLLFHVMIEVGFTNYEAEWWHYDFGNQFWAAASGAKAVYGPCRAS